MPGKKDDAAGVESAGRGTNRGGLDEKIPLPQNDRALAAVARLRPVLADVAQAYQTSPLAIVLAWLMRHPSKIIPIYGSTRPEMIKASTEADKIDLDRNSWYRILFAARGKKLE